MLEDLIIVLPGIMIPLAFSLIGLRAIGWVYFALIPLYMYEKSMFLSTIIFFGRNIQWITLSKDLVGTIIILLYIGRSLVSKGPLLRKEHKKMLLVLIGFMVFYFTVGILNKNSLLQTIMGARPYLFYSIIGIILGPVLLKKEADWRMMINVLLVISLSFSCLALIHQYLDPNFLIHPHMARIYKGALYSWQAMDRLYSIFTRANVLGAFMQIGIVICVWNFIHRGKSPWTVVSVFSLPLFFWVLVLSLSRSSFLGAALGSLILFHFHTKRKKILIYLVLVPVFVGAALLTPFRQRFLDFYSNPRLIIWYCYIHEGGKNIRSLLFGKGVGSTGRYGVETGEKSLQIQELSRQKNIFYVDNFFVKTFFETGILGSLFCLWVFLLLLRLILSRRKTRDASLRGVAELVIAIDLAILIDSMFAGYLGTYPWNLIFWVLLAGGLQFLANNDGVEREYMKVATVPKEDLT